MNTASQYNLNTCAICLDIIAHRLHKRSFASVIHGIRNRSFASVMQDLKIKVHMNNRKKQDAIIARYASEIAYQKSVKFALASANLVKSVQGNNIVRYITLQRWGLLFMIVLQLVLLLS